MFQKKDYSKGQTVTYKHKIYTSHGVEWETVIAQVVAIFEHTMLMSNGDTITVI